MKTPQRQTVYKQYGHTSSRTFSPGCLPAVFCGHFPFHHHHHQDLLLFSCFLFRNMKVFFLFNFLLLVAVSAFTPRLPSRSLGTQLHVRRSTRLQETILPTEVVPKGDSPPPTTILKKLSSLLKGEGFNNIKLNKDSLAKLGLNALLAYGFVSNVSYITCVILAWVTFGKSTGLSPLAPGQWKKYLLVYAGFFAANNVIRPLRFSLSLVITPAFDKIIDAIQSRTKLSRPVCTGITVFLVNVCGTFSYLFGGLFLATTLMRVPLFPN